MVHDSSTVPEDDRIDRPIIPILPRNLSDARAADAADAAVRGGEVTDLSRPSVRRAERDREGRRVSGERHITPVKGDTSIIAPHYEAGERRGGGG